MIPLRLAVCAALMYGLAVPSPAVGETRIRIMPVDGSVFAAGQRFDIRVEATNTGFEPPQGLRVFVNGADVSAKSELSNGPNVLIRGFSMEAPGELVIEARTVDGAFARAAVRIAAWQGRSEGARARNIILLLGDGMGIAHRTAARLVSKGLRHGRAAGRLAMDTLEVTGLVMTASLNAAITDSSPGMSAYVTGQKSNNNQQGVFPDNTPDPFDNPRIEYLGELLRRVRGPGFNVGIVTTADVTDSTPAANAIHTADRYAASQIAARYLDERETNAVTVLLGGGSRHFMPAGAGGERKDGRRLADEFDRAGFVRLTTGADVRRLAGAAAVPSRLLGLFHPSHLPVAFDKLGAGRYSDELARPANSAYRDLPMLDELTRLALRSLSAHSPAGFYLMVEGASIDKRAHAADAERTIWDVLEFDRAVAVALEFARTTNTDADSTNDTLVIVTADHETGGAAIVGVGNERYAPTALGRAVRDYAAVFRFEPDQVLDLVPNYAVDTAGYPLDPDPSRKVLLGWAAAPDRYENWLSNRLQLEASVLTGTTPRTSVANAARDSEEPTADNASINGVRVPGFLAAGVIENGATGCPPQTACPADTAAVPHLIAGHTAEDVPLSASGPGAWQFTGVFENTDVFVKMLRAVTGAYASDTAPTRASGRQR